MHEIRDPLTGLLTPDAARERLADWLQGSGMPSGPQYPPHVMLIGLRRFQSVNLAYGEDVGDLALAEVARRLRLFAEDELDGPWMMARLGGRDFLLATQEPCSRDRWHWLGEEASALIADPFLVGRGSLRLSSRVALLRAAKGEGIDSLMDRLSQALNEAHRQPAGRSVWADGAQIGPGAESNGQSRSAAMMEGDLHHAIDRGEIELLYQPQFSFADGRLTGAEALARWRHPVLGRVGAKTLFSVAERTDYIAQISQHIAEKALACGASWPQELGPLRLSLNVTAADLAGNSFMERIRQAIWKSGFAPARLTLEVTEQAVVADLVRSADALRALHDDGVKIAIDDFGTGFSNFQYLKILPLDYLKLDQTMTADIASGGTGQIIVEAIIQMALRLGLEVVAEGVETGQQRDDLAALGCHYYQGYVRAAPMSADDFMAMAAQSA